ncbi:bifunctional phosphoribosylaminoimidazolecarboxamide formyltransferase/IMP cyclohydrolase [Sulfoacidibacillus thermotolerans]|uniref:Bifunctional purine biosynthesis protein PurH n=1 Tax=Sulfoacidibacillus thermotolerans TaxID=1765684 RepID=A0A2U3D8N5_SULT2|nr:bifunctional phosphoribosylaminoimidazolecarboxamide formyltransferase/IMP cyclohydrolase [Sulfoacidibacillus thermotolerans]PWI57654.1 bifunctional phosphoribosylaminoimidazolecarboxamide formyltransferase/IMP cyclohydrolase [Sulfoacidibacillus thermotolerans]
MARALISVSDKTGIVELAQKLQAAGVELVSTGGTFRVIAQAGIPVREVSEVTGFPEMMDGRVKTLHPLIHGGLLALRDNVMHMQAAKQHGIEMIDYVIVNLYPFSETIAKADATLEEAIENIDIGGPSMLRAAAKNYPHVVVLVDPSDYAWVGERVAKGEAIVREERFALAAKVFRHTAAYDAKIADYLTQQAGESFPQSLSLTYEKAMDLRYGENPHQKAAFYTSAQKVYPSLQTAVQKQGKELSYNNIQDANAALDLLLEFTDPTVVAVKHMNPCGVGTGRDALEAFTRAYEADPVSIFGGIVAFNRVVDAAVAKHLTELFLEIVMAPAFTEDALAVLAKKKNVRVLELGEFGHLTSAVPSLVLRSVRGGLLIQESDWRTVQPDDLTVVTKRAPSKAELDELLFAWKIVKHVKSNAIVLTHAHQSIGIGAGQMNRVGAAKIAIEQAGERAKGSVLASDAFFPMPDTLEVAAKAGIQAVIQPGGSIKDQLSIDVADEHGIAMVFTGVRHFRH